MQEWLDTNYRAPAKSPNPELINTCVTFISVLSGFDANASVKYGISTPLYTLEFPTILNGITPDGYAAFVPEMRLMTSVWLTVDFKGMMFEPGWRVRLLR